MDHFSFKEESSLTARNEDFERSLILLWSKVHQCSKKIENPSRQQVVVCGLASKCLSHCEMALKLVIADALGEAIILLRAAYEAIIRAIYLDENPDNLPAYDAFSTITTLRNQLEVLKILDEFGEPYEGRQEQQSLIEKQKEKIIAAGYHTLYKLEEHELDSWDAVRKVTNKSNLPSFEDVRRNINKTPLVKALLTTGFQVYNVGSQVAHSSLEMMTTMVYFEMKHPLCTQHFAYRQILLLVVCCCQCLASSCALSAQDFEALKTEYQQICKQFLSADATD